MTPTESAQSAPATIPPAEVAAKVLSAAPPKIDEPAAPAPAETVTFQDAPPPGTSQSAASVTPRAPDAPAASQAAKSKPTPGDLDAKGTPFDPAKHSGALHPVTKTWMPRGGRTPGSGRKPDAPATPPPADAWGAEARAFASAPAAPAATSETASQASPAEKPAEPEKPAYPELECDADNAAEIAANGLYLATGFATGESDEARLTGAEHGNLKKTLSAYFRSKGWHVTGGLAVVFALVAYALKIVRRPKTEARVNTWWQNWRAEAKAAAAKPVKPAAAPVTRDATSAPPPPPSHVDLYSHLRES